MRKLTLLLLFTAFVSLAKSQLTFDATPEYGKLYDITYDASIANKLYALTLTNHLMVSEDNGLSWQILYTLPKNNSSMAALRLMPGSQALSFTVYNSNVVADNGLFVYDLITNSITHHFTAPNSNVNPNINAYSFFGADANTLVINSSYSLGAPFSKVYYTNDGGTNWKQVYFSSSNKTVQVNNVAISPADSSKIYLMLGLGAGNKNGGLWVSEDAGTTWATDLDGVPVNAIAFNPSNADDIFVGTDISFGAAPENLYHSTDGGASWNTADINWADGILNNITQIKFDPANNTNIWLLEENEYAKSTDGGTTWQNTVYPLETPLYYYGTSISINPYNSNEVIIMSDGFPVRSADGGATLKQVYNPFYAITDVAFANYSSGKHLYYSSQGGYLQKNLATDSTARFNIQSPFIINAATYHLFPDTATAGRVFIFAPGNGFSNSSFKMSHDYGATTVSIQADDFAQALTVLKKDPNAADIYYVAFSSFSSANIYKIDASNAANPTATLVNSTPGVVAGMYLPAGQPGVLYISKNNQVLKSKNGGKTFTPASNGLTDISIINDMEGNPFNTKEMAIATDNGVFMSYDSAQNWQHVASDIYLDKIDFSPVTNGQLIAAAYTHLYTEASFIYSSDAGNSWQALTPDTLSHVRVSNMDFDFYADSINIYSATPDLGVTRYLLTGLGGTLPVTLLSFTGKLQNNNAVLQWNTTNEVNVQHYTVQTSTDGKLFNTTAIVNARNTTGTNTYSYTDTLFTHMAQANGTVYYRLQLTDVDGKYTLSPVIALTQAALAKLFNVYPNPVQDVIHLLIQTNTDGKLGVCIFDMNGKACYTHMLNAIAGNNLFQLPAGNLAKGIYTLVVTQPDGSRQQLKLVKNQ